MKKQSDLSRLMGYAGNYRYFTYASWVLSAVSALVALVPFVYIWKILRDVLNAAPDYAQAVNIPHYGWMAVLFAVLAYLIYIAALMCSHLSAFRVATNLRLEVSEHLATLPLGFTETFGSGKLRKIIHESTGAAETYLAHQLPDQYNAIATPVGLLVLLLAFDWRLGLLSLAPVVLAFLIMATMTGKRMVEKMRQYGNALEAMSNEAVEYVRGIPVVKTFGQSVFSFKKFKATIDEYEKWVISYTKDLRLPMMFYTTVAGWMLHYFYMTAAGKLSGLNADEVAGKFTEMLASPGIMTFWMVFVVVLSILVCAKGLQNGLERVTKGMMIALLLIMVILAVNSLFMDGAKEGLSFFLVPDFGRMKEVGIVNTLVGAMNQAFFTLSLGIGAMSIFGSYIGKEHSLLGESVRVVVLDTFVAITAGLIIFPARFTFGVDQTAGPSLIFITLPNIFANMALGRLWGSLFFLFMAFAALSTVLAVFENIICCGMELTGCTRKKSSLVNLFLIILLSMPCVLGYNLWAWDGFSVFGGAVLDFEDFLVSNLFLPLGSLVYLLFCVSRYGWGWDNYKKEVNTGEGMKIHDWMRGYHTYGLPVIVLFIFAFGIYDKFFA